MATLVTEQARPIVFTSLIWSITPLFQKTAIFQIYPKSPLFTSFAGYVVLSIAYFTIVFFKKENIIKPLTKSLILWLAYGANMAISQWAAYTAFSVTHLGYASAVFKLSSIFLVVTGALVFKEKKFKERLIGAIIILFGTVLLIL
jgi:drug/metabolite transporter (DMT)-like permease